MQVYSKAEASIFLGESDLGGYLSSSRKGLQVALCKLPVDTGSKTQMASYLSEVFLGKESSSALIAITGWSAWPSQTNFDLFNRYRQSFGEARNLIDSPYHHFGFADKAAFASILDLCLYFLWDAEVIGIDAGLQLALSHHETLDVYAPDESACNRLAAALFDFGCDRVASALSEV
jgi:hypothetical protein